MIIPELEFFEVEGESSGGDSMMFHESLLGKAPKPLQAIYINSPEGEVSLVVHFKMTVTAIHQRVIASVAISIDDAAATDFFDGEAGERLCGHVRHHLDRDLPAPLQNAKNWDFAGRPTSAFALPPAAEVALIQFDFPLQSVGRGIGQDRQAQGQDGFVGGVVGDLELLGDLPGGEFQFEQLEQAKPLPGGQTTLPDPAIGLFHISHSASPATPAAVREFPEFSRSATGANSLLVFEAKSQQVPPRTRFALGQMFKGLKVHDRYCIPVQKLINHLKVMPG